MDWFLIGTNVPKALEHWKVINSRRVGPYTIKTILSLIVSGPLQRENAQETGDNEWQLVTANRTSVLILEILIQ